MDTHDQPGFFDTRPERIEGRIGGRLDAIAREDRTIANGDHTSAALNRPVQLCKRGIEL
jgi:hypothetical protein